LVTDGQVNSGAVVGAAGFNSPIGSGFHPDGSLYVADTNN